TVSTPSFYLCLVYHRDLHSFPTRRSSDLLAVLHQLGSTASDPKEALGFFNVLLFIVDSCNSKLHVNVARAGACFDAKVNFSHAIDRKSTRLNSSHVKISYAVFCLKKKKTT